MLQLRLRHGFYNIMFEIKYTNSGSASANKKIPVPDHIVEVKNEWSLPLLPPYTSMM